MAVRLVDSIIAMGAVGVIADIGLPEGPIGTFRILQGLPFIEQALGMALLAGAFTMWVMWRIEQQPKLGDVE